MNKVCVIAVNSKYTHSSLALRYFRENCGCDIFECSINDNVLDIFSKISEIDADIFAFSTYIWNVEFVLKLASVIKKADESKKIILGGPEAGYNAENILKEHLFVDGVIKGEGEYALKALSDGRKEIPNFCFRDGDKVVCSECVKVNLEELKFPYTTADLEVLKNRLVYFETSRGCLYNCSYCLSSSEGKTRYFSQDYVFEGLDFFINNGIPLVKFVDRTFNENNERACKIADYIVKNSKVTHFHMEIAPQLLTDEFLEIVSHSEGKIQFEMGIQTTNPETMREIRRIYDKEKIKEKVLKIPKCVHTHLDLIAGLPFETKETFKEGFDYVYSMRPDMLQLGFLKVLHNTKMKDDAPKFDIRTTSFPPYEVISTDTMSKEDIISLKNTEKAVDRIYNSGAFKRTLDSFETESPFDFFEKLGVLLREREREAPLSRGNLYRLMLDTLGDEYKSIIAHDFLENNYKSSLPDFLSDGESTFEFFDEIRKTPEYKGKKIRVEKAGETYFVICGKEIKVRK